MMLFVLFTFPRSPRNYEWVIELAKAHFEALIKPVEMSYYTIDFELPWAEYDVLKQNLLFEPPEILYLI